MASHIFIMQLDGPRDVKVRAGIEPASTGTTGSVVLVIGQGGDILRCNEKYWVHNLKEIIVSSLNFQKCQSEDHWVRINDAFLP